MGGEDANDSSGTGGNDDGVSTGGAESSGGSEGEHSGGSGNDNGGSGGVFETGGTGGSDTTGGTGGTGDTTMECEPGDQKCTDLDIEICNEEGHWEVSQSCPFVCNFDQMFGAQCIGVCEPNATQCSVENYVEVCNEYGQWSPTEVCPNACVDSECVGSCKPGHTQCAGDNVQVCNETGSMDVVDTCEFVCSAGECVGVCEPGDVDCMGSIPRICNASGQWIGGSACEFLCTGSGNCTGECNPGATRCTDSGDVETCDAQGSWQFSQACTYACLAGSCTGECVPGTDTCSNGVWLHCESSGYYSITEDCEFVCDEGQAPAPLCTGTCFPGATICEDQQTLGSCSSLGEWEQSACPNVCYAGQCMTCIPNATQCSGNSLGVCNATGSGWDSLTECSENSTCIPDDPAWCQCDDGYERSGADCVRCGEGRFEVSGPLVIDTWTGLEWQREDLCISSNGLTWTEANAGCLSQGDGWRLPTHTELDMVSSSTLLTGDLNRCAFISSDCDVQDPIYWAVGQVYTWTNEYHWAHDTNLDAQTSGGSSERHRAMCVRTP